MSNLTSKSMSVLGVFILLGLISLGYFLVESVNVYKEYDRTVSVKGLSQKDYKADIILWPIKFTTPDKDLFSLNNKIEEYTKLVLDFLEKNGIKKDEINILAPAITDKMAND